MGTIAIVVAVFVLRLPQLPRLRRFAVLLLAIEAVHAQVRAKKIWMRMNGKKYLPVLVKKWAASSKHLKLKSFSFTAKTIICGYPDFYR